MQLLKLWGSRALLPLMLGALVVFAYERQWLLSVDYLLYDSAQQLRAPTILHDSVVVAIDEQSIAQLGRWPWSRQEHAKLINVLAQSDAKAIYLDVLFADQSTKISDDALAAAMKKHGQVALPMSIEPLGYQEQLVEVVPAAPFYAAAAAIGHAHVNCDFDGVCRSLYLREGIGRPQWLHLSAAFWPSDKPLTGRRANSMIAPSPLLIYRDHHNFIPFSPNDRVPIVSYVDVLDGHIPLDFFNDKNVFVGATAAGVYDILTTPIGRLPGVEITAFIHHHLYSGNLVQLCEGRFSALVLGALLVVCLAWVSVLSSAKLLLGIVVLIAIEGGLALCLLLGWGLWLPIAPVLMATLLFYPLWSWLRLELAMRYLKRSLVAHHSKLPPSANLIKHLKAQPPKPHWLVASDTVASTIEQLETVSIAQEASHNLLQQSISGLQEGCIIFDEQGCCFLVNNLAKEWLPHWDALNVFDIEHHLKIQVDAWAAIVKSAFSHCDAVRCEAEEINLEVDSGHSSYFLQIQRCKIKLDENGAMATVGVLTLTNVSDLKASERVRAETLNFISHDLRSPLVSIISLIKYRREMCPLEGEADDALDELLTKIERYANRNLAYSESLLQLNRAEQLSPSQIVLCDLLAVCEDAYEQVLPFARANGCPLIFRPDEREFWVSGDYELLQRAVVNLLTNAVKYGATHKGVILSLTRINTDLSQASLGLSEEVCRYSAKLTVKDFGVGMTDAQQAHAFERFTRDASAASEGAGLGLYFIKTVITNHLGALELYSEQGKGCEVTCVLPLKTLEFMD